MRHRPKSPFHQELPLQWVKINSVLFFAPGSHLEEREDGTFVPLKEGNYSGDSLLALFPGMRDLPFTARALLFHQDLHVRPLLWKGSHLPATGPFLGIPLKSRQRQPIAPARLPEVTDHCPFVELKLVTSSKDFSSSGE